MTGSELSEFMENILLQRCMYACVFVPKGTNPTLIRYGNVYERKKRSVDSAHMHIYVSVDEAQI